MSWRVNEIACPYCGQKMTITSRSAGNGIDDWGHTDWKCSRWPECRTTINHYGGDGRRAEE